MEYNHEKYDNSSTDLMSNDSLYDLIEHMKRMESNSFFSQKSRDIILIFSYSLIVLVSFVGNLFVCKVILSNRTQTTTDKLIINLSISDLLMTVLNIPFNIVRFVLDNWPFGKTLCIIVPFSQSLSVHCSSITMMFIAIERYKSVFNLGNRKCLSFPKLLFIIWMISCVLSVPHGIFMRVVDKTFGFESKEIVRCQVIYPKPEHQFRQRLTVFTFLSQYFIPILLTGLCYLRISLFLWGRRIVGNVNEDRRATIMRDKIKRIKMLMTVVLIFAICWLPLNVYHLLADFDLILYSSELFFSSHWLAMSSVCYNPFIYCWLNESFKTSIKRLFRWRTASRDRSLETEVTQQNPTEALVMNSVRRHSREENNI